MLYSARHKFCFIHVPKTGGTSLTSILKHYSDRTWLPLRALGSFVDQRNLFDRINGHRWSYPLLDFPRHVNAVVVKEEFGAEKFDALFKFGFVRNPYDYLVSEYFYVRRKPLHALHDAALSYDTLYDYALFKQELREQGSRYGRCQSDVVCDHDGTVLLDYVGKFESYTEDANEILRRIGIQAEIPHKNKTEHRESDSYYDDRTRDLVRTIFANDFDNFGY